MATVHKVVLVKARRDELCRELLTRPEFVAVLLCTEAQACVATGVRDTLARMRGDHSARTRYGLMLYTAILAASLASMCLFPSLSHAAMAAVLGLSRQSVSCALQRVSLTGGIALLDPTRKRRTDALSVSVCAQIKLGWEMFTRPSPDMKHLVRLRCGPRVYVEHGIHWLMDDVKDVYDKVVEYFGKLCSLTAFQDLRPYFVRNSTWTHSLCPYCYETAA